VKLIDYQNGVKEYVLPTANNPQYLFTGLAGEVGEVCSLYAKAVRDTCPQHIVTNNLIKELGDVMWFVAMLCNYYGLDLEDVMESNLDKLSRRKANGTIQGSGDER